MDYRLFICILSHIGSPLLSGKTSTLAYQHITTSLLICTFAYLHTRTFLAFVLKHQLIIMHIRGLIVPPLYQLPVTVNVYMKITVQL